MGFTGYEQASGILYENFLPGTRKQINEEAPPLWKILIPNTKKVSGSTVKWSAQVENPQGVASRRLASQAVPRAVPGKYIELEQATGRIYGTMEFDSKMIKAIENSKEDKTKFVNYTEQELTGIKETLLQDLGRQAFGNKKGTIFTCGVTAGVLEVELDDDSNMSYAVVGMRIDIVTTATGVCITNGKDRAIAAVELTAGSLSLTVDGDGGVVTTDATMSIIKHDAYNAEMIGLSQIVSDTEDIYGIVTANERRWQATVSLATGALTEKKVVDIAVEAKLLSGVGVDIIVSHPTRLQQYFLLLQGTRSFDVATAPKLPEKLSAGYRAVSVTVDGMEALWIGDPNCPKGDIYGLRKSDIEIKHLGEVSFMNIDGKILLPNIYGAGGTPTLKTVLEYYPQMICRRRNSMWVLKGVTDPA